jgi:hypothetical protein
VSVHGVRGARDAVEIEADAHFDPDRRDVGEGALRQILAAELLPENSAHGRPPSGMSGWS